MEDHEQIQLRSEEVQEILGTPPKWIVRWGSTIIAATFVALLWTSWAVQYPDIVLAPIVLTTSIPPVDVIARSDGRLAKLSVKEGQMVEEGQVLVILQSTGRLSDIQKLDSFVNKLQNFDMNSVGTFQPRKDLELGELQGDYSTFVQLYEDFAFSNTEKSRADVLKINSLQNQVASMRRSINVDLEQQKKAQEKLNAEEKNYLRQQQLYSEKIISQRELEEANSRRIDLRRDVESYNSGKISKEIEISNIQKLVSDVVIGSKEGSVTKFVALRESISKLRSSLDNWQQKYLVTAPIAGKVSLNSSFFSEQQFVKLGDELMAIVPTGEAELIGRVQLPITGSGKVKEGQRVLVRLENFPWQEYGQIEGVVDSKSAVPKNGLLPILVKLPAGLKTSYGKNLVFEQKMQGTAHIITENRRFIERIFDSLKSLWLNK